MEVDEAWLAGYGTEHKKKGNEFLEKFSDKIKDLDDMQLKKLFKIIRLYVFIAKPANMAKRVLSK